MYTIGPTDASTKACGETIKWRARGSSSGPTVANMKVTTSTTKRRDTGRSIGRTEESTRATGRTASSMGSAFTRLRQARLRKANGKRVNARHGSECALDDLGDFGAHKEEPQQSSVSISFNKFVSKARN